MFVGDMLATVSSPTCTLNDFLDKLNLNVANRFWFADLNQDKGSVHNGLWMSKCSPGRHATLVGTAKPQPEYVLNAYHFWHLLPAGLKHLNPFQISPGCRVSSPWARICGRKPEPFGRAPGLPSACPVTLLWAFKVPHMSVG